MTMGYAQSDFKFQEFSSLKTCEEARKIIQVTHEKTLTVCTEK